MKNLFLPLFISITVLVYGQTPDTAFVRVEVDSLIQLNQLLLKEQKFDEALKVIQQAEVLCRSAFKKETVLYTNVVSNIGETYNFKDDFSNAALFYTEALNLRKSVTGERHPTYINDLQHLAALYMKQGNYKAAELLFLEAKDIGEEVFGKEHPDQAGTMGDLASLYLEMGNYKKAEALLLNANKIREKTIGKEHPDYALTLNNLGILYRETGQYEKVEPIYLEALALKEKTMGKNNPAYCGSMINLANLYAQLGKFDKAKILYLEAKAIFEQKLKLFNHPFYALCLDNIASIHFEMGRYDKTEPLALKALEIYKQIRGRGHLDYCYGLINLADLYTQMGKYDKAESFGLEAKTIFENDSKLLKHQLYGDCLDKLADLYRITGKYDEAESLFLKTLAIHGETLGKDHPQYGTALYGLAILYRTIGKYEKAEPLHLEAKAIFGKTFGKNHHGYAGILYDMGVLYEEMGQYKKAEPLYLEALSIYGKVFEKGHPTHSSSLTDFAIFNSTINNHQKADTLYQKVYADYVIQLKNYYPSLSEEARIKYLATLQVPINHMYHYAHSNNRITNTIQNMNLLIKGLALEGSIDARLGILTTNDSLLTGQYNDWMEVRRDIAAAYTMSRAERSERAIDLNALGEKAETLEANLSRTSKSVASQLQKEQKKQISAHDLTAALGEKEAAIDIIHYKYMNGRVTTDSVLYGAFISRPSLTEPKFVFLSEEQHLQKILKAAVRKEGANYIENLRISLDLYKAIWEPLEPYLEGVDKIHLSPSGILHRVAFGALQSDITKDTRLMDRFEIAYYGNLRDFVLKEKTQQNKQEIVLLGGAQYNLDSLTLATFSKEQIPAQEMTKNDDEYIVAAVTGIGRSIADDSTRTAVRFNYLPGTLKEVESISKLFQNKKWNTNTLLKKEALEDNIKSLSGINAPGILHIASHGYFFSPYDKDEYTTDNTLRDRIKYADNPLLRSGLVFTGVNHAWEGGQPVRGMDDGVLTAYEISNMDLLTTDLVVLSACETGLGDVHNGEGVFGLQRAFKTAGVDNMIISLWKVPDAETSELMALFYENYLNGKSIRSSLRDAQREMAKKYSAYYWAGFVLVE